ncbi:DUF4822 domain-containing protein [Ureibacillus sinduriensis]|uniref:DUF4822 domain-containing protein n=1 Tax=Ureibacillus sinduriensis BLB-1 = JCM 15800 TaxID=1384057 RepID=A0A0A3IIS1_9BACL|nr:DUF4822 domain-containing protein [Ureibacillus sinduriensis]KGR74752.1 hypothetical protein CD33_13275 [Ureibacillus sinduriensis BLB-1 = JCM 15800]
MNKTTTLLLSISITAALIAGCNNSENNASSGNKSEVTSSAINSTANKSTQTEESKSSNGDDVATILGSTLWQGTKVYDKDNNDLTEENSNFIAIAKYDYQTSRYEFFDKESKNSRGDYGTFFMTNDGKFRVLISESKGTQGVVELTEVTDDKYIYKRIGKDANGNDVEVFVEHEPYTGSELTFTSPEKTFETLTGEIDNQTDGDQILANTLWVGSVALDENGNDVSEYNQNFFALAKYDAETSQYEFFDKQTGQSRGDYGYYNVLNNNKVRAHVSLGDKKYGAVLEVTELNENKFTYKRIGKDQDGKDIPITVEHIPYTGELNPEFTQ